MVKSVYGERETIGSIALQAAASNQRVEVGDMSREFMPQLIDDLNEAIASNPFDGRPFYIIVHEKKDLLLKNVVLRRMIRQEKRPYPEPNTSVFWTDPQTQETLFCWSLPHKATFVNYIMNASKYEKEQIKDILAYNYERMDHFGFYKLGKSEDGIPIYQPIPNFKDRKLRGK
jgi:hypothetical protein